MRHQMAKKSFGLNQIERTGYRFTDIYEMQGNTLKSKKLMVQPQQWLTVIILSSTSTDTHKQCRCAHCGTSEIWSAVLMLGNDLPQINIMDLITKAHSITCRLREDERHTGHRARRQWKRWFIIHCHLSNLRSIKTTVKGGNCNDCCSL